MEILTKLFVLKEQGKKIDLKENELLEIMQLIAKMDLSKVAEFWCILLDTLEDKSMHIVREHCTPFLVKGVFGV